MTYREALKIADQELGYSAEEIAEHERRMERMHPEDGLKLDTEIRPGRERAIIDYTKMRHDQLPGLN